MPGNSTTRVAAYGLVLKQRRILLCRISARITEHAGIIYFTEVLGGSLTHEVDGSTDLCEWHHVDAVRSLPIVDLVESSLELVKPDS